MLVLAVTGKMDRPTVCNNNNSRKTNPPTCIAKSKYCNSPCIVCSDRVGTRVDHFQRRLLSVSFPACLSSLVAQLVLPLRGGQSSSICSTCLPPCDISPPITMAMAQRHWVKYHPTLSLSDPQLSQSKHRNVIGPAKVTWCLETVKLHVR